MSYETLFRIFIKVDYSKQMITYEYRIGNSVNQIIDIHFNQFFTIVNRDKRVLNTLVNFPDDFLQYMKLKYVT